MEQNQMPPRSKQANIRWLAAALGLIFLVIGQYQIAQNEIAAAPPTKSGAWLLSQLHLAVPSIDNVIRGLPVLLLGATLLFVALRGLRFLPEEAPLRRDAGILLQALKTLWPWLAGAAGLCAVLLWQISILPYSMLMLIEWLLAPLLALAAFTLWDQRRQVNLSPGLGRKDILWMLGLFTLGILIGVYRLQGMPDMLVGDEGSFWTAARSIASGEYRPSIFANGVYTFPVMSSIAQAAVLKVFGSSLWGWRFGSVLAGALTVFPLYLLAQEAFDRKVAVTSGFALTFSPYFLAFARLGYNNIQALFITTLALYWVYTGIRRSSYFYLFLAGCAAGLGFYTYFSVRMALVIALLFIGALWLLKKIKFKDALLSIIILSFGAALVLLPHLVYGNLYDAQGMSYKALESMFFNIFNGEQFYTREELSAVAPIFKIGNGEFFYHPQIYLVLMARGFLRTLLVFQKAGIISEHFIAFPLAGTIGVVFYLLGFGSMFKRIKEPRNLLFLLWFGVVLFALSALNTVPPRQTHMVNIIPLLAILTGLGITGLTGFLATLPRFGSRARTVSLSLLTGLVLAGGMYDYFVLMPRQYFPQPDQIISWAGFSSSDETLVYVYTENVNPALFHAYSVEEFESAHRFEAVKLDQFQADLPAYTDDKSIVFYLPDLALQVQPLLAQTWGEAYIPRTFFNREGFPILDAGTNTAFVFERERTFGMILADSYLRPALLYLLAVCLALLGLVAFFPGKWLGKFSLPLQRFLGWFNTPVSPAQATTVREETDADVKLEFIETKAPPGEPPEWSRETFPVPPPRNANRVKIDGKAVRDDAGRNLYLRIHLPAIPIKTGWKIVLPDLELPAPLLLAASILSEIVAQLLIYFKLVWGGIVLYGLCAALFVVWARLHPKWMSALTRHVQVQPKAEIVIAIALLLVILFTRFYDIGYRVYGIEADESKWTVQAWYSAILRVDEGEFASMHYQYLPVTFWLRSFFLRMFGMDFISARIESGAQSVLAAVFLYLLVKRLFSNPPLALLSAALYAFSYVELNASHQALHNTTIEAWMMAGLYFAVLAVHDRKVWMFQVTGFILALGMLTYETIFPSIGMAILTILGVALWQSIKRQASPHYWLTRLFLLLWPVILVYFIYIRGYLQQEQYHFGWLEQTSGGDSALLAALTYTFQNIGLLLKTLFSGVVLEDALLRWHGSYINQFLLPFAVIGLVYNLLNLRRPAMLFFPLLFLLNVGAAPLSVGAVWPRILYSSLSPVMVWGALGLWVAFATARSLLDQPKLRLSPFLFVAAALTIFGSDYYTFTHLIGDPLDRVQRRELADLTAASAAESDLLLYPYMPAQNDPVELESHVILFSVAAQHGGSADITDSYAQVPFADLLTSLWEHREAGSIDILYDKSLSETDPQRAAILETLLGCYPGANLVTGGAFFEVYRLDAATLASPACHQTLPPTAVSPANGINVSGGTAPTFTWSSTDATTGYTLTLQERVANLYWLEAEDVFVGNGWYANSRFVTGYSGTGFLEDSWNSSEIQVNLQIAQAGEYRLWVRSFKRRINDQQNYVSINGGTFPFAGETSPLDEWVWEPIGIFDLPAGAMPLSLSRTYGQDTEYSVFIDAILLTPNLSVAPENTLVWETVLEATDLSNAASSLTLEEPLDPGEYRWSVRVFDGNQLIDSQGNLGIPMPFTTFTIQP